MILIDTGDGIAVAIALNVNGQPPGKLADCELRFASGPLEGLSASGFAVWQSREAADRLNVTVPRRTYEQGGEKKHFNLWRIDHQQGVAEPNEVYFLPLNRLQRRILRAYESVTHGTAPPAEIDDDPGF